VKSKLPTFRQAKCDTTMYHRVECEVTMYHVAKPENI